jgi:hypothetical protein
VADGESGRHETERGRDQAGGDRLNADVSGSGGDGDDEEHESPEVLAS